MLKLLNLFPKQISEIINENNIKNLEEIRIRTNKPIILKFLSNEIISNYIPKQEEILKILQILCDNSIYSYQNQICNGYITIDGGHRVGITGDVVIENGKVKNISYIYSLNFRIAKQIEGASKQILKHILDIEKNDIYNTLIVGSPGTGKTTIIRDLTKEISNGNRYFQGITVGVIDERGEISAMHRGVPQNDLGIRTDILNNVKKSIGIEMMVRSMSPRVIVADEIGNEEDISAIKYALCSGVKGIFTAHGKSYDDLIKNPIFNKMIKHKMFEKVIILDKNEKGKIEKIYVEE